MKRKCLILLNLANFTGSCNHGLKNSDGTYEKLRVDYSEFLKYLIGDRECLGAYVISQQDTSITSTKSIEQLQTNQKFVQKLKNFGWTPIRISYNSKETSNEQLVESIWQNSVSNLLDDSGTTWEVNPAITDIVFVNGSVSWFNIINTFSDNGFQVEVAYPKIATSKLLTANFAFLDITQFLIHSNLVYLNKNQSKE